MMYEAQTRVINYCTVFVRIMKIYARLLLGTILLLLACVARGEVALSVVGRDSSTACTHDAVHAEWVVKEWRGGTELVWIEVHDLGRSTPVSRLDLFQIGPNEVEPSMSLETLDPVSETLQRLHSVIQSRAYGALETPEIRTVGSRLS